MAPKKQAQPELIRLLAEVEAGLAVDPSKVTVAEYLRWDTPAARAIEAATAGR
ncbi:MAG TPA: hypothetical protein VL614_10265 [Acetobacteraceae bacterium]|nr:hypothetical protein [Acetobacteraceae bacterium]